MFELERYLSQPNLQRKEQPLEWWAKHSSQFKTLSVLAKKYLAIPATETTSERVFSVAGLTATRKRSSLSPEHVNMLVLLHENIDLLDQK